MNALYFLAGVVTTLVVIKIITEVAWRMTQDEEKRFQKVVNDLYRAMKKMGDE